MYLWVAMCFGADIFQIANTREYFVLVKYKLHSSPHLGDTFFSMMKFSIYSFKEKYQILMIFLKTYFHDKICWCIHGWLKRDLPNTNKAFMPVFDACKFFLTKIDFLQNVKKSRKCVQGVQWRMGNPPWKCCGRSGGCTNNTRHF